MPRSIRFSKTCGSRQKRIERNGPVSCNLDRSVVGWASLALIEVFPNRVGWNPDLGRSATLFDISDDERITTFWISYWKDLKGLQGFATSSAHSIGQNAYLKKKFPYMGVMHETYHSPKGSWETIYDNMPPNGLGKDTCHMLGSFGKSLSLTVADSSAGKATYVIGEGTDGVKLGDALKPSRTTSAMYGRTGRVRQEG